MKIENQLKKIATAFAITITITVIVIILAGVRNQRDWGES